jgi:hypothetical protein
MWGIWVLKDAEFYADFKNIDLPLWQNAHEKVIPGYRFFVCTVHRGSHGAGPVNIRKPLSFNYFFSCILSLMFVLIETYVKFWFFRYPYTPQCEKNVLPLCFAWPLHVIWSTQFSHTLVLIYAIFPP